jgi:hypothetical protein
MAEQSIKMFREYQKEERIAEKKKVKREKAETERAQKKSGDTWADLYFDVTIKHFKVRARGAASGRRLEGCRYWLTICV